MRGQGFGKGRSSAPIMLATAYCVVVSFLQPSAKGPRFLALALPPRLPTTTCVQIWACWFWQKPVQHAWRLDSVRLRYPCLPARPPPQAVRAWSAAVQRACGGCGDGLRPHRYRAVPPGGLAGERLSAMPAACRGADAAVQPHHNCERGHADSDLMHASAHHHGAGQHGMHVLFWRQAGLVIARVDAMMGLLYQRCHAWLAPHPPLCSGFDGVLSAGALW